MERNVFPTPVCPINNRLEKCGVKVIDEIVTYFENFLHIIIRCEPCCWIDISIVVPAKRECVKILVSSYVLEIRVLIYKVYSFFAKAHATFTINITGILAIRTCKYIIKIISGLAYRSQSSHFSVR